jgi:hypothetical protein
MTRKKRNPAELSVAWLKEYEGKIETITFPSSNGRENNPFRRGVGIYVDVEGRIWEVHGIFVAPGSLGYVMAREIAEGKATRRWVPYRVEIKLENA